ncbi:hypothetical protein SDC9_77314 [bioreactor metagenome]|uniref:Uncharacterized protein n=1 Tax=bioreactor metagenome TaxID=1076179 RepID=A0A644YXQ3_9ZZZZ
MSSNKNSNPLIVVFWIAIAIVVFIVARAVIITIF